MITAKINVTLIDKSKLFKGNKGTYLDIVLIDTPESEYGDFMIVQSVSKEERAAGVKGAILGNAKLFKNQGKPTERKPAPAAKPEPPESDDIPF